MIKKQILIDKWLIHKNSKGETMKVREEQKEKRRQEILFTALDLFVRKGYVATTIRDIAGEAHMSVGLLFNYFETKERLCEELVKIGLKGTQLTMQQNSQSGIAFFEEAVKGILYFLKEQPWIGKMFVFMAQVQRSEGVPSGAKALAMQVDNIEQSVKMIKQGQQEGSIREGNPLALSNAFWCSIQGVAEHIAMNPDMPFPEPEWFVNILKK